MKAGLRVAAGRTPVEHLVPILDLVRAGKGATRPELIMSTGLGRTVVTQRVRALIDLGLLEDDSYARSTGGRPSVKLTFRAGAGSLLVAQVGATGITAAITDLVGSIIDQARLGISIAAGPDVVLTTLESLFDALLARQPGAEIWGIGVGLPGPVEFSSGYPVSPPIMPGWDHYPVRERFSSRYQATTWVDNDVNMLAVGEMSRGLAHSTEVAIYVKIGTGIGAGLLARGELLRGAQGVAGDIGHVAVANGTNQPCRCGKTGCLEAVAGGGAIARRAEDAARAGRSKALLDLMELHGGLTAADVSVAAMHGDGEANEILNSAGRTIGESLAALVNFINPSILVLGGGVAGASEMFLASIRQSIYQLSPPLATRDLKIVRSLLGYEAGIYGASAVVSDLLFSAEVLPRWIARGSPARMVTLATD